ncbi:mitochondrial 37S ribosomal protein MRPS5 [Sugiyamaella lignohabitans]|uniref:Small ribosomal subunit protein uS5m n=1 Tax=Sugiyamaella lignohabitans TaxID=796027 RepID=A0A167FTV7_9ASCO|nr:mitochondrial 37S ribosomal protein MRPS5 [Sugiyamaella lignohabitans]ANB15696.1 mitochondrial 37S ribosomal protein MRPS5 [Sugiyamaella lignohabitans]
MLNTTKSINASLYTSSLKLLASKRFNSSVSSSNTKKERDEHVKKLKQYYPPSLIKSILAAEASISPEQWADRKPNQTTEFGPIYTDDYAKYHPLYDFPKHEWLDKSKPWQPIPQRLPPGVALIPDEYSSKSASNINLSKLEQLTGLSVEFLKTLTAKPLIRKRVVNMTRKGKQPSFYALAVVGNRDGLVGLGEGRDSSQPSLAIARAHWNAIKNLRHIPRFEDRTIFGNIDHKSGAVVLNLRASTPGSGLRVNHIIYEICKAAGIKDLVGNVYRSRNPMNVAKAAVEALSEKQVSIDEIAASRGKKIVDVTNTYYNF